MKIKGYLATHFFNEAGYEYTKDLAKFIREETSLELYVPQENGEINDKTDDSEITDIAIAKGDNEYLDQANILIASLDGVEIDAGVASEIGYFSGVMKVEQEQKALPKQRIIIGLYTDIRRDGSGDNRFYINLYTKGLVNMNGFIVNSKQELVDTLKDIITQFEFEDHIKQVVGGKY